MSRELYFDNSLITKPSNEAVAAMMPYFTRNWGSPAAPHEWGNRLLPSIEESLRSIYKMLGAGENDHFVFTSSGAEAVNHAVNAAYTDITLPTGRNQFLTSNVDEAPQIMAMNKLEKLGSVTTLINAGKGGLVTPEAVGDALTPRSAIVSLSWACGLTGVIHPAQDIAEVCKERGVLLHLDASHVLGKLYFEPEDVGADIITFEGSLLHAPQGTGGLWWKDGLSLSPFITGGTEQASKRAGPMNPAGLASLAKASEQLIDARDLICMEGARLRTQLEDKIKTGYPEAVVFCADCERLPHIAAIGFPGISNEALLFSLSRQNVFASIGGGNFQQIGLILEAGGVDKSLAHTAVSFSLSRETTDEDIEKAAEIIVDSAKKLRKTSTHMIP
jgi:cysteine desulfurase